MRNQATIQKSIQCHFSFLCLQEMVLTINEPLRRAYGYVNQTKTNNQRNSSWVRTYKDSLVPFIDLEKFEGWNIDANDVTGSTNRSNEEII
jgi:hypothetical protein